jgi:dihydrofolate reductase
MKISLIAALGRNKEIGANNDLMWHLPADMRFFKSSTLNHVIIMGRRNYDSIPERFRPFSDRTNMVITRDQNFVAPGCHVFTTLQDAIAQAKDLGETEAFVIGGAQIYDLALQTLPVDHLYLTHIEAEFPQADTFFPTWNESEWTKTLLSEHAADEKHAFSFKVYRYDRLGKSGE